MTSCSLRTKLHTQTRQKSSSHSSSDRFESPNWNRHQMRSFRLATSWKTSTSTVFGRLVEPASSERSPSESTSTESLLVESTVSDNRPVEPVSSERRDIASVAIEGVGELAPTATTPLNPAPAPRVSAFGRPLRAPVRFVAAHRVALRTNSC